MKRVIGIVAAAALLFVGPAPSGWSQCDSPVTWIVDTRGTSAAQGKRQLANLRWALRLWPRASGLRFVFGSTTALTFDEDDFTLTPEHAPGTGDRRVFFDFIAARKSILLAGETPVPA